MIEARNDNSVLEVRRISKSFAGLAALTDLSFAVRKGHVHGIIGPNGAGKTTLFNVVTSVLPPTGGEIIFNGKRITGRPPHEVARLGIARTFQNVRLFADQSVIENVAVGAYRHTRAGFLSGFLRTPSAAVEQRRTRQAAISWLDFVGLSDSADLPVGTLPFGLQRLAEMARALALQPTLLLLDEPAAGLNDGETENLARLIGALPSLGITVVLVEHNMTLVMGVADEIIVLNYGGKIAEGTPSEIQANPDVITAYLGGDDGP